MIARDGANVSRETKERLESFVALVQAWTKRINLISSGDTHQIWDRHVRDSLQLDGLATQAGPHWLDIGSGGGFPGIVLAILHAATRPEARHTLIESDQRKAAFLLTAKATLGLDVRVLTERSEAAAPQAADVITARAFAPLSRLLSHVDRHMTPAGQAILPKGAGVDAEIEEARAQWAFRVHKSASETSPAATILRVTEVSRA